MKQIVKIDLTNKNYGGRIYENQVINQLKDDFNFKRVFLIRHSVKFLNLPWIIWVYLKYKFFFKGNLILTNHTTWLAGFRSNNLVIVHHIDNSRLNGLSGRFQKYCNNYLFRHINRYNHTVVVANYWLSQLKNQGFNNLHLIYNSFDANEYHFSEEEILSFKSNYNLLGKPIIYLGNCQKHKGVVESYNALKDIDCHFVTSGIKDVDIPSTHLNLNFKEYKLLLAASDVVITMSHLIEGWNRTAHEALLAGTPVIGSGSGGMKELLEMGNGIICTDFKELMSTVQQVLNSNVNKQPANKLLSLNSAYFYSEWHKTLTQFTK